ncbi:Mu transposase C-terminal domain-containing protein, partial [Embleya sp. NPDC005575]|uniref:Mu transposase C-terminal domain-containing protein n=1 Tax=Embleya sp. NPDC005575 TaxID=3156892 RepID=UPI0033BE9F79
RLLLPHTLHDGHPPKRGKALRQGVRQTGSSPVLRPPSLATNTSDRRQPRQAKTSNLTAPTPPNRHGHVVYESLQFRAGTRAPAVGKAGWQNRPHDGLRDPSHPGRPFTPNEKYAALVEACGYVPVALSGQDYVELLPAEWRVVNDYGVRVKNRIYDSPELGPMRRRDSGVTAKRGLWEIHRDPYDASRIWVRDHRGDGSWVQAIWKHLNRVPVPFGDLAWDHVSHRLPGAAEAEIADAVAALQQRTQRRGIVGAGGFDQMDHGAILDDASRVSRGFFLPVDPSH